MIGPPFSPEAKRFIQTSLREWIYVEPYEGGLATAIMASGTNFYLTDANENVVGIAGADGDLLASYEYSPYGSITASTGSIDNPFQFAGGSGETTGAGDLVEMRARYYDPSSGRFISGDPTGTAGGLNVYQYANNNSISNIDLNGLYTVNVPSLYGGSAAIVAGGAALAIALAPEELAALGVIGVGLALLTITQGAITLKDSIGDYKNPRLEPNFNNPAADLAPLNSLALKLVPFRPC